MKRTKRGVITTRTIGWTQEKERMLIKLVKRNANIYTIENRLNYSRMTIHKKLNELGYKNLTEARKALKD